MSEAPRSLGSVTRFDPPFDVQTILRAVGAAAGSRGLAYFEAGAVQQVQVMRDAGGIAVTGQVAGTRPRPYEVHARIEMPAQEVAGWCSCPVGTNCKHVAAALFAAGKTEPGGAGPSSAGPGGAGPAPRELPLWERILQPEPTGPGRARRESRHTLALLIEPKFSGRRLTAPMRPMGLGKRDRWIRTGASWREVSYPYHDYDEYPAQLLREILTLYRASLPYYYGEPTTIELTDFRSSRIWAVLAEAAAAGLPLISDVYGTPVVLEAETVAAQVAVTASAGGSWQLSGQLLHQGTVVGARAAVVGEPAHGIAYLAENSLAPGAAPTLHLAALTRRLEPGVAELFAGDPVPIPAADTGRFTRDYLPWLRNHAEVVSPDESVPLPSAAQVRLRLAVARDDVGMVQLAWHWRYIWGDEAIEIPLDMPGHPDLRDTEAETTLSAAALAAVLASEPVPPLVRQRGGIQSLNGTALLSRSQALRLTRSVLPSLRDIDGVMIDVADGALEFREATSAPVVAMAGSITPDKDWLDLTVTVTVDGEDVPFGDLFRALAADNPVLILPSGTYFPLGSPELNRLRSVIDESYVLTERHALDSGTVSIGRYEATLWDELEALGVLDEQALAWSASVRELARVNEIPQYAVPATMRAELRPYQLVGYRWLAFLQQHGLGGVLADDMGLGKTLQTLAMIARAREENPDAPPFLVVAPTSVVPNWVEEARRFVPGVASVMVEATASRRGGVSLAEICSGADVVVTSYALFRLEYDGYAALNWSGLLLDEAQQIKNHQSKGYRCARKLAAPFKLAITGTPMENNLMELWSAFSIVAPGLLGDPRRFNEHYRGPIERGADTDRLATLRRRIQPLLLRRTKSDVLTDLPPKTEQVLELELGSRHRRAYDRFLARERRKVLGLLGDMDRNRFQIFRSLTLLRQAALDVALVGDDVISAGAYSRTDSAASGAAGEAANAVAGDAVNAVAGEAVKAPSTKLEALVELVAHAAAEGHRVLVFSQFTRFLGRARERLTAAGIASCYLDGATRRRASVLQEFREGNAPAFLISLKAGGVGLNLTEADYCIITDPWWNPATEQQAVDRTHRIGQQRPVMVYRLIAKNTIEDKVMALKERKAALFSAIMTDGGVGAGGLTASDIRALLS